MLLQRGMTQTGKTKGRNFDSVLAETPPHFRSLGWLQGCRLLRRLPRRVLYFIASSR
jgi:hypothetical protein